jgi:hypothetical protein
MQRCAKRNFAEIKGGCQVHLGNEGKTKELEVLRLRQDKLGFAQDEGIFKNKKPRIVADPGF